GDAPHGAAVSEEIGPPLARRRVDQRALRRVVAEDDPALVGPGQVAGTVEQLRSAAARGPADEVDVVPTVDLLDLRTLRRHVELVARDRRRFRDQDLVDATDRKSAV